MNCNRVREQAAGLAALPEGDPERRAAFDHARNCTECRRVLREGERLLNILSVAAPTPPSSTALERVLAAVRAQMTETTEPAEVAAPATETAAASTTPGWRWAVGGAIALAWVAVWLLPAGIAQHERNWVQSLLLVAIALAAVTTAGSLRHAGLAAGGLVALSGAASIITYVTRELPTSLGAKCLSYEIAVGALAVGTVTWLAVRRRLPAERGLFMLAGAAGAVAGQAALELRCPGADVFHLIGFHTGGVLVALALGALISSLPPVRRATSGAR